MTELIAPPTRALRLQLFQGGTYGSLSKGQKKQKTTGKLGWRSKKANHGRKPGMGRGKRN